MSEQRLGCVVLVIQENKILLGKRKGGYKAGSYGLPGGRVEVGGKLEDCVKRELLEETGLTCDKPVYVGVVKEAQGEYDFVHFVFKCENFAGEPQNVEPEKCEGWEWFGLDKLPSSVLKGHVLAIDMLSEDKSNFRDI